MAYRFSTDGKLDRPALLAELRRILDLLLRQTRLELRYDVREGGAAAGDPEPQITVSFRGRDEALLLERNSELLLALEHIIHRWLQLDPALYDQVQLDCGDHRALRYAELRMSAKLAAERVIATRQPFPFNPMSSRERRMVHLALKDVPGVRTQSEGVGERRHIVIYPA